MFERVFLKHLDRELPRWVDQGWVDEKHRAAILEDARARADTGQRAPLVIAVLGTLLFGAGVITFFAANWDAIPKAAKLGLLFTGMWAAFGIAGFLTLTRAGAEAKFGHAFLLLGVILFGANIFLIAQIYHISAHFPDGVLYWAIGALLITLAVPSQTVAIAGLVLTGVWSFLETGFWEASAWALHWPFLIVWAPFTALALRRRWRGVFSVAMLVFFLWFADLLFDLNRWSSVIPVRALANAALFCLGLYIGGLLLERLPRFAFAGPSLRRYAAFFGLLALFGLSLRVVHGVGRSVRVIEPVDASWLAIAAVTGLATVGMAALHWRRRAAAPETSDKLALALGVGFGLVTLMALLISAAWMRPVAYLLFAIAFFASIVLLIHLGYRHADRAEINTGFVFFGLGLLTLYFDTFWSLMDRSFFFMGGGLVLLGGGWLLLRQRGRLVRELKAPKEGGET